MFTISSLAPQLQTEQELQNLVFPMKTIELDKNHDSVRAQGVEAYR